MKSKIRQRSKKKKVISKTRLVIITIFLAIIFLFVFYEKVHKIGIVENIKKQAILLSEQIQSNIANLNRADELTIIDVTNLVKGKETEHEHLWKKIYDENNHWEECTVCGEKQSIEKHSYTTTWALGYESCHRSNYYTKSCLCGYSFIGCRPCVWNGKSYFAVDPAGGYGHSRACSVCKDFIMHSYYLNSYGNGKVYSEIYSETNSHYQYCKSSNGTKLDCNHLGYCTTCKTNYTTSNHYLGVNNNGGIYCIKCNKTYGTYSSEIYIDNNTPLTYKVVGKYNLNNGASFYSCDGFRNFNNDFQIRTQTVSNKNSNGTQFTITSTGKLKSTIRDPYSTWIYVNLKVSNRICPLSCDNMNMLPDSIKPIISNITMENKENLTEWSRTKPISIRGTENYCNTVTVKILDDENNAIFSGTVAVNTNLNNDNYSISSTPYIEADENGRKFKAIVTDSCNNSTEKEFTIAKVDAIPPKQYLEMKY